MRGAKVPLEHALESKSPARHRPCHPVPRGAAAGCSPISGFTAAQGTAVAVPEEKTLKFKKAEAMIQNDGWDLVQK